MSAVGKILRSLMKVAPAGGRSRTSRKLRGIATAKKKNLKELKSLKKEINEVMGPDASPGFKELQSQVDQGIKDRSPSIRKSVDAIKQRFAKKKRRKKPTSVTISMVRLGDVKGELDSLPAGWGRAQRLDRRAAEAKRNIRIQRNKAKKIYDAHEDFASQFDHFGDTGISKSEAMAPLEVMDFFRPDIALEKYGRELYNIKHYMTTELQVFRQLSSFEAPWGKPGRARGLDKAPARMAHRLQRMKRRAVKKRVKQAAFVGAGAYAATREKH